MVEGVDQISPELQSEALCNREVLVQTQIYVAVMRRTKIGELRRAVTERSDSRLRDLAAVDEPLTAYSRKESVGDRRNAAAVRSNSAAVRTGLILRALGRHRPTGTEGNDRANLPAPDDSIHHRIHVLPEHSVTTKRKVIDGIGGNDVSGVVIAW